MAVIWTNGGSFSRARKWKNTCPISLNVNYLCFMTEAAKVCSIILRDPLVAGKGIGLVIETLSKLVPLP